jgi:bifunctional non-homologous end joining protein LigD
LAERHKQEGLGDAPWPPQYKKQADEPPRVQPSRRRVPKHPLITVAHSFKKDEALEALETWKKEHAKVAALLEPADILVDAMRGRSSTWTRIRINLQHVPEPERPTQPTLPPPPNPWEGLTWAPESSEPAPAKRSRKRRSP